MSVESVTAGELGEAALVRPRCRLITVDCTGGETSNPVAEILLGILLNKDAVDVRPGADEEKVNIGCCGGPPRENWKLPAD